MSGIIDMCFVVLYIYLNNMTKIDRDQQIIGGRKKAIPKKAVVTAAENPKKRR